MLYIHYFLIKRKKLFGRPNTNSNIVFYILDAVLKVERLLM